jgi:hypothetical protein
MRILRYITDLLLKLDIFQPPILPPVETLPLEIPKTKEEIIDESLISIGQQISGLREVIREYIVESDDSDVRAVGHIVSASLEQTLVHLMYARTRFEKKERLKGIRQEYSTLLKKVESNEIKLATSKNSILEVQRQLRKDAILEEKVDVEYGIPTMNYKEFTEIYGE